MSTPAPTTTIVATETVHLTLPILVGLACHACQCCYVCGCRHPHGTFKLCYDRNEFSFKHVMEHVIRIPNKCHIFCYFVTLASLKVPLGFKSIYSYQIKNRHFSHHYRYTTYIFTLPIISGVFFFFLPRQRGQSIK